MPELFLELFFYVLQLSPVLVRGCVYLLRTYDCIDKPLWAARQAAYEYFRRMNTAEREDVGTWKCAGMTWYVNFSQLC